MKKLVVFLMAIALCACLFIGCTAKEAWEDSGFIYIKSKGRIDYLYYEETGVIYAYDGTSYRGGLAPLLNPDGTPMIWEGN